MAGYVLSENDREQLRQLLEKDRKNPKKTRLKNDTDQSQSPDVYIARTPHEGIPALAEEPGTASFEENDQPGYADCTIYFVSEETDVPTLEQTDATPQRVYNLSTSRILGDTWVVAIRDKFNAWYAIAPVGGRTGCQAVLNPCTGLREYNWYSGGILTERTDPCPECEEIPDDTGTGTGTGTTDTPVTTLLCGALLPLPIPVELCLSMGSTVGFWPADDTVCRTTFSKTVRLILQPTSTSSDLKYYGETVAPPGSIEAGINDIDPVFGGPTNQPCTAKFWLEINCDTGSPTGIRATLSGWIQWREESEFSTESSSLFSLQYPGLAPYLHPSNDPAAWGGATNLVFTSVGIPNYWTTQTATAAIDQYTVTSGPCVPCPNPPFVQTSTYSITGTTPYVIIDGDFPDATVSNTTVIFNLGAAGVVTEVNAGKTKLTVLFTIPPTSTGALTAIVTVNDCCNSGPGHSASDDDDVPSSGDTIDIIGPLVIAPPFEFV